MTKDFEVEYVQDLSDIPEDILERLGISPPSKRQNNLSREPDGSTIVVVYRDAEPRLFDRIKDVDTYIRAIRDNLVSQRAIQKVYVIGQQS